MAAQIVCITGRANRGLPLSTHWRHRDWLELFAQWCDDTIKALKNAYEGRGIAVEFEAVTETTERSTAQYTFEYRRSATQDGIRKLESLVEGLPLALSQSPDATAMDSLHPESVLDGYGIEKSSVSRQFVEASSNQLRVLCERRLEDLNLVVLMIDGIHFGGQVLVVALGIAEGGEKHVLGVWQGATENTTVVKGLLEDLVDRGLDLQRRYLVVIDGSKALRAGVERVFGEQVEVQRCQLHKRRNVKEYLPENCQKDYDRRMRNAYAMNNYAEAKEALQKIFRQLERINPSAARSLEEGLEETLTVHRLGVGAVLRRKLATTNPIESCLSTVQRVARNVKRWREGSQPLRWTATGLLEAEKKFRRIKGYQEILLLKERLNPSRIPQKEVRAAEVA